MEETANPPVTGEHTTAPAKLSAADKKRRIERYSVVVEKAELSSVRLINAEFNVRPDFFDPDREDQPKLYYDVVTENREFDPDHGLGIVFLSCTAGARRNDEELVDCTAKYLVTYQGLNGCEEEATRVFLSKVGRFTCYPFFRSLFATFNAGAGTDLPTLPVLKEPLLGRRKPKASAPSE